MIDSLQIWKRMGEERRLRAAQAFYEDAALGEFQLAANLYVARTKNLRPQFMKKLPAEKRASYLAHTALSGELAAQLIVSYHFARQRALMSAFLNALGIPNDQGLIGEGADPAPPAREALAAAVQSIEKEFTEHDVLLYLATLHTQNPEMWTGLAPWAQRLESTEPF